MSETGVTRLPPAELGDLANGSVVPLILYPDPLLRLRCEAAGYLTADALRRLARDMLATMYAAGGRGLAAPQIGVLRRVIAMDAGWKQGLPAPLVLLDPEISARSPDRDELVERCLSLPDTPVLVSRALTVEIGWYDLQGIHHHRLMTGPEARIVQHEADHLDGRLIVDFLS